MFKSKKIISVLLIIVLMMSFSTFAFASSVGGQSAFPDVGRNYDWARDAIDYYTRQGIVKGMGDGLFYPQENVTREQFARLLVVTFNEPLGNATGEETFADVASNRWSYQFIEAAKYYLTGYYLPKGKPLFDPTGSATREDIAVALAKVLGYKDSDIKNPNILDEKFDDGDNVSPNLRNLVSIAVENRLIVGSNRMLRPDDPITRAEALVILLRAMKYSVGNTIDGLRLDVECPEAVTSNMVYITGKTEPGAAVYINNEGVYVDEYGRFKDQYMLKEEGNFTFNIDAYKSNLKASVQKAVSFSLSSPEIYVNDLSETTDASPVNVTGWVADASDRQPKVYVNGTEATLNSDGSWQADAYLTEGVNTITIEAVNNLGKNTVVTKQINFASGAPVLTVTSCPETTNVNMITVSGAVYDNNDKHPRVYVNNHEAFVNSNGSWSATVKLVDGENTVKFEAMNNLGKTAVIEKKVTLTR